MEQEYSTEFQLGDYVQLFNKRFLPKEVYYIVKIVEGTPNKKYILCKDGKLSQPLHEYDIVPLAIARYFHPEKNGYKRIEGDYFASIHTVDVKSDYPTLEGTFDMGDWDTGGKYTIKFKEKVFYVVEYMHELQHIFRENHLNDRFYF